MVEQLVSAILEMQVEEEPLIPVEMDPVLLMSDKKIKEKVEK